MLLVVLVLLLRSAVGSHQQTAEEGQPGRLPPLPVEHQQRQRREVERALCFDLVLNPLLSARRLDKNYIEITSSFASINYFDQHLKQ